MKLGDRVGIWFCWVAIWMMNDWSWWLLILFAFISWFLNGIHDGYNKAQDKIDALRDLTRER